MLSPTISKKLTKKLYTLVFVHTGIKVLLGLKKRGFGVNKWNGFGGKVEPDEQIVDAAARELWEESRLRVHTANLKHAGHLEFTFEGEPAIMDVRVFTTQFFEGQPQETDEMIPKWYSYDQIPYKDMWLDDPYWLPKVLKGIPFYARFHYKGFHKIVSYQIKEVPSMAAHYHIYDRLYKESK